jgi:hypothetical protein
MKKLIVTAFLMMIVPGIGVTSQMPAFIDVVMNSSNTMMTSMHQSTALRFCEDQKNHLPSIRELAQLAMSSGAKGITDACGSDSQCYLVQVTNAHGAQESFYYSYAGYKSPNGHNGVARLWSSTSHPNDPFNRNAVYIFNSNSGLIEYNDPTFLAQVRCVEGR